MASTYSRAVTTSSSTVGGVETKLDSGEKSQVASDRANKVASQAEEIMSELFKDRGKVSNNSHEVSDSVKAYFDKIRKQLDHREKALLSTIHKYSDIKLTRLDIHYRTLEQHRSTILECVSKIEQLIDKDDNVGLLSQKQTLSEDLDAHEHSIISLAESLAEARKVSSQLMFRDDQSLSSSVSELGTLNECRKEPESLFMSLRRVIVTEEEDPYLDVPLRFEDMEGGEHMRFDESKEQVEYEPQSKPHTVDNMSSDQVDDSSKDNDVNVYNVPKPVLLPKPQVPPRKSSFMRKPALVRRPRPTHDYVNAPARPPKPAHLQTNTNNAPRKSVTMPRLSVDSPNALMIVAHERQDSSDSDKSDYEPLPELPTPSPRTIPPPLPPNHPSHGREDRPIPRPRRQLSESTTTPPTPPKPRSKTLPHRVGPCTIQQRPPPAEILKPVLVLDNKDLSWPYSHENVYPSGICCCASLHDTLVVTDVFNHCLRLIDYKGKFIEKIGREGRSGGQFKEPSAVAVDHNGHMYATERDNPRVQKFTHSGKYITKFGQKTLRGTQLSDPIAVAITPNGLVAVSDWDKNQILFFSSRGKLVNTIPNENSFLKLPAGIAFNKLGHLLVADRGNHCVWELTSSGELVRKIGSQGSNPGQLNFPYGVITDDKGRVVVSESGNSRISVFSQTGDFICSFGEHGAEPGQFDHPRHLCLNSKKQLIVADEMNQRLQVFENYS